MGSTAAVPGAGAAAKRSARKPVRRAGPKWAQAYLCAEDRTRRVPYLIFAVADDPPTKAPPWRLRTRCPGHVGAAARERLRELDTVPASTLSVAHEHEFPYVVPAGSPVIAAEPREAPAFRSHALAQPSTAVARGALRHVGPVDPELASGMRRYVDRAVD